MKSPDFEPEEESGGQLEMPLSPVETLSPIRALHRGENSFVGFSKKREDGSFENLFSLQIQELEAMFPAIAQWLIRDAYFTVNGMYRAAPYNTKTTGLPGVWRKESHLKYLNACYVDLDVGRDFGSEFQTLTWRDAAAGIGNLMDAGLLPQSSIFARSGRGVYVFWILHDDKNPELPPRYWPERLALYKKINRAVSKRLIHLAADEGAFDASRVLRVPGTQHSKSGEEAVYFVQHNGDGRPFSYTLSELAQFFGVREMAQSLPTGTREAALEFIDEDEAARSFELERDSHFGRLSGSVGSCPARAKGARILNAKRAQDLITLEQSRGGWPKGKRKKMLTLYASFLRGAGNPRDEVLVSLAVMARNCRPSYPSDANDTGLPQIVAEVFKGGFKRHSNEYLLKALEIKTHEVRALELQTLQTPEVKEEQKPAKGGTRGEQQTARQDFIKSYIERNGVARSSCRVLVEALKNTGIESNPQTVNRDLEALGFKHSKARPKAGRKDAGQLEIPET
jgi:hypothetical protein